MKIIAPILIALAVLLAGCSSETKSDEPAAASETEAETATDNVQGVCEPEGDVDLCCSARKCTGKVLSNRDAHNCKVKSKGKSWWSGTTHQCTNL